jgi:mRNA interferase MazF
MVKHIVKQGDIIEIELKSQVKYEETKYCLAVVISNNYSMKQHQNITYVCPITENIKSYPTRILLDERTETKGLVLCENIKSLDLVNSECIFVEKCPKDILSEVVNRVKALIDVP